MMQPIIIPDKARAALVRDPVLKDVLDKVEVSFPPSRGSVYADLVEAIVYQQISIKAAQAIFMRICRHFGGVPSAEELLDTREEELRALGLSRSKAQYMKNIAAFFLEEKLGDAQLQQMDNQVIVELLTRIKGVGEWTVQMILIFSMAREDVFPAGDYGVLSAMLELYGVRATTRRAQTDEIITIAETWRPYRTYGTLIVWSWKRQQIGFQASDRSND
jgi:DNA-3-methyladenine glycosylase II